MLNALKWATASNIINEALVGAITLLLAIVLSPEEFGTVALVFVLIAFVQPFLGFGFSTALVQSQSLEQIHLNSVFWLNLGAGLLLAIIVAAGAGAWAGFFELPDLRWMVISTSLVIPLQGISVVQTALLQRRMDFRALAIRTNSATAIAGIVGIMAAIQGYGAWALIAQYLVRELSSTLLVWRLSDWRPSMEFRLSAAGELWPFAGKSLIGQFGTFVQNNADGLVIGALLGPAPLGLYRFADRLVEMNLKVFPRAMQAVSLSHFSRLQHDAAALNEQFLLGARLTTLVTFPALAFLAGSATIILGAIGKQWIDAGPALQALAALGAVKAVLIFAGPTLQAMSRPGLVSAAVWMGVVANIVAVIVATGASSGLSDGTRIALVAGLRTAIFSLGVSPLLLYHVTKTTALHPYSLWLSVRPAIVISAIIYLSQSMLHWLGVWDFVGDLRIAVGLSVLVSGAVWLAYLRLADPKGWGYILRAFAELSSVRQRAKNARFSILKPSAGDPK